MLLIMTALLGAIAVVAYMWKVALEEKKTKKLHAPKAPAAAAAADGKAAGMLWATLCVRNTASTLLR